MLLQRKSLAFVAPSNEKYLIFMLLKVRKWTVISPAKNYQNFLKRALLRRIRDFFVDALYKSTFTYLRRKKLHLIWPTQYNCNVTSLASCVY